MSFADPQSMTINAVTNSLPLIERSGMATRYVSSDGLWALSASHALGRRARRVLRFDHAKIAPSLLVPSTNEKFSGSVYTVFDFPRDGYTNTEITQIWTGYITQVRATSDLLVSKLIAGES